MSPYVLWAGAALAVAVGYLTNGWRGVALVITALCFWMVLQFTRVLKVLNQAGRNPMGLIENAVMFNARLSQGMRLTEVIKLARSLGRRVGESENPETWAWADPGGDEVQVHLQGGRVIGWQLVRAGEAPA
jgi:hypothetical protein